MKKKPSKKRDIPAAKLSSQPFLKIPFLVYLVLLILLNLTAYSNTFRADWQFDDVPNIVANADIQIRDLSWKSLEQAAGSRVGGYRPVAYLTFALNYYFFGFDPPSFHAFNLLIHVVNALLVFEVLRRISNLGFPGAPATAHYTFSFLAAAFWSLSPLQTQSVTYIVQRMNLLAAFFGLLCIRSYLSWREASPNRVWWGLGAAICALLALGSKENAVVLPLLVLALEWCFSPKNSRLTPKITLAAVLGFLLVTGIVSWRAGLIQKVQVDYAGRDFSLSERLLTQPRVIVFHLTQLLVPLPSRLALKHEMTTSTSLFSPPATLPCLVTVLVLFGWGVICRRRWPLACFSTLWFLLGLSAESSFLPLEMIYEHRLYLPSVGFFCVCLLPMLSHSAQVKRRAQILLCGALPILAALTYQRNVAWKDKVSLWLDNSLKYPTSARVLTNLGTAYSEVGDLAAAENTLVRAFEADPAYPEARSNLALLKANKGELKEALQLMEGLTESRGKRISHAVYFNQGVIYAKNGYTQKAIESYEKAAQLYFRYPEIHFNLALLYLKTGERSKAQLHFRFFVAFWRGSRDDPFFLEGQRKVEELSRS
jgi:hypothetical protein